MRDARTSMVTGVLVPEPLAVANVRSLGERDGPSLLACWKLAYGAGKGPAAAGRCARILGSIRDAERVTSGPPRFTRPHGRTHRRIVLGGHAHASARARAVP